MCNVNHMDIVIQDAFDSLSPNNPPADTDVPAPTVLTIPDANIGDKIDILTLAPND